MKRILFWVVALLGVVSPFLHAVPTSITYQGSLREQGIPAKGPKNMDFVLVDATGGTAYSQIISTQVTVTNGLFSAVLNFQLVSSYTWDTINPYVKVSVEGQALTPIEPITSTIYSLMSASVADNSITPAKVASGYGLVPAGAILMFDANCPPTGWVRFSGLDGLFPRGAAAYGSPAGGSHTHSLDFSNNTTQPSKMQFFAFGSPQGSGSGLFTIGHETQTDSALPPYRDVVFCKKL